MTAKIHIIGILDDGPESLSHKSLAIIGDAELLIGGERHLNFFPHHPAEKFILKSNLPEVVLHINKNRGKKIVVLASGDPLFYGIGKYLLSNLPPDDIEVVPTVTSLQMAFAKLRLSWEDAILLSVHARPLKPLLDALRLHHKIGLLTGGENTPDRIAQQLIAHGVKDLYVYVCENLGGAKEAVVEGTLEDIACQTFSPLNVMILIQKETSNLNPSSSSCGSDGGLENHPSYQLFGIPDESFYQRKPEKGLITKQEIRVLGLSKMKLKNDSVVWDIGAGSGSISIEAARLAPAGRVYAVEKNAEDIEIIQQNIQKFSASNIQIVHTMAPEGLSGLPKPDAIFIGGSGGNMEPLIQTCYAALNPGGRLVIHLITLDNLASAISTFKTMNLQYQANMINISRSKEILDMMRFEALNPIFLLWVEKP